MVQQHAAMLANVHAFRLLGLIFVCCTPLIFLMRRPAHQGGAAAVH